MLFSDITAFLFARGDFRMPENVGVLLEPLGMEDGASKTRGKLPSALGATLQHRVSGEGEGAPDLHGTAPLAKCQAKAGPSSATEEEGPLGSYRF